MLGHPALVAGDHRGDPQRQALLAEQRVAAVAGAERPDLAGLRVSGRCTWSPAFVGQDESSSPSASGVADASGRRARTRRRRRAPRAAPAPIRVMIRIETADVGRVGELDADLRLVGARAGPSRTAPRTSCDRSCSPRTGSESVARISAGVLQLLVGPASSSLLGADVGPVLDPGDVAGVRPGEIGVRALRVGETAEGAGLDELVAEAVVLLGGSVAPVDRLGRGQGWAISSTQLVRASFCVGASGAAVASVIVELLNSYLVCAAIRSRPRSARSAYMQC